MAQIGQVLNSVVLSYFAYLLVLSSPASLPMNLTTWELMAFECLFLCHGTGMTWALRRYPPLLQFDEERERFRIVFYNSFLPYGPLRT